jgi:hypothetical protein
MLGLEVLSIGIDKSLGGGKVGEDVHCTLRPQSEGV